MKSALRFLAQCAAILTVALIVCPSFATAKDTYAPYAYEQNQWDIISRDDLIGQSPSQVWRKLGKPDWTRTTSAGRLAVKIPSERLDLYHGPGTTIRVYGYTLENTKKEIYFASESGKWRVIGDADYPKSLRW